MGAVQQNRWQLAFAVVGVALAWAAGALGSGGDAGSKISKSEAKDLIQKILALIGMTLDDLI